MPKARPLAERFWEKVDRRSPDECWPWIAGMGKDNYGCIRFGEGHLVATHVSLAFAGRPLQPGQFALHTCDNPPCVNPAHLYGGSKRDNMRDAIERGRHVPIPRFGGMCGKGLHRMDEARQQGRCGPCHNDWRVKHRKPRPKAA